MWINKVLSYEKIIPMFFRIARLGNNVLKVSQSVDANETYFRLPPIFHYIQASQVAFRFLRNSQSSPSPRCRTRAMLLTAKLAISLAAEKLLAMSTRRPVRASCAVFQTQDFTFLFMVLCVHIFDEGIF